MLNYARLNMHKLTIICYRNFVFFLSFDPINYLRMGIFSKANQWKFNALILKNETISIEYIIFSNSINLFLINIIFIDNLIIETVGLKKLNLFFRKCAKFIGNY